MPIVTESNNKIYIKTLSDYNWSLYHTLWDTTFCMTIRSVGVLISVADNALRMYDKNDDDPTQTLLEMILSRCIIVLHYLTKSLVIARLRRVASSRESNKITTMMITCLPLIQALTILSMRIPTRMSHTNACLLAHESLRVSL